MNWKSFMIGVAVGVIGGYAAKEVLSQNTIVSADKALANVKSAFKNEGPIRGSWINMNAEPFEKNGINYKVYKGGITRNSRGLLEQYEFIVDAMTGGILEAEKL